MRVDAFIVGLLSAAVGVGLAGCALFTPLPKESSLTERLAAFPIVSAPLQGRVTILWDDHQIPFIEAEHDADAAVALGMVHAHLRLGQMEIFRRIAQGRIAEMGGPLAADIDHALRIIGFGRGAAEIERALPPTTRAWLEGYVAGINHYQRTVAVLPMEFAVLGLDREPWTVRDVLTFGRLAGTDVNWLIWFNALRLRQRPDWRTLWARLVETGGASLPSFGGKDDLAALEALLAGIGKSGSNSLAIAPARTTTGGAIMASDPHLGISVPNLWLIVGLKSPSYHAVGLMAPGLPVFAIGRNPWIAWGGTNMRAASSDLYDVSDLPADAFTERTETVRVRWWFDREVTVRETAWGPVLSDAPMLRDRGGPAIALRWTGHQASDEITAMLAVAHARDFDEFRAAFRSFAVPGQNMLFADAAGTIGQVMAVRLPARDGRTPTDLILDRRDSDAAWNRLLGVDDLPFSRDPERGFLVSANNRPTPTEVPVGFFFSPDDRVLRMNQIIRADGRLGVGDVKALQQDVRMPSSVRLCDFYLDRLRSLGGARSDDDRRTIAVLADWDGDYRPESRGALAFAVLHAAFGRRFYAATLGAGDGRRYAGMFDVATLIDKDVAAADPTVVATALRGALHEATERLDEFPDWGAMHRLVMAHPLSFLPLIGGRYRFADFPAGGSSQTLMKTAHDASTERHGTRYGSNARHISDMTDPDRNYFVLLGGQDGWINSSTFLDQVALWRRGDYVTVPLGMDAVRAAFRHRTVLAP